MAINFSELFLLELFNLCFKKREVLDICCKYLDYHHLKKESHKFIWKSLKTSYQASFKVPSMGLVSQQLSNKLDVLEEIEKIKNIEEPDVEGVITQFDEFLKDCYFIEIYEKKLPDLFNDGNQKAAYTLIKEAGEYLNTFSVKKDSIYFERVFGNYNERQKERILNAQNPNSISNKIPFFMDEADFFTYGGPDKGDTWLGLSQSGVGKSKFLKHIGVNSARIGKKVLHIQGEGSKKECLDLYDAAWSGQTIHEVEGGWIKEELEPKLQRIINGITKGSGEIFIYAAEQFDSLNIRDIRNLALDLIKMYGNLDEILIDYFELFDPGDGKIYKAGEERQRREAISEKIKNLALETNTVVGTMTQASTVDPQKLNDPNFYMTRYDISEFKGALKPFSYFFTFNQTHDEYEAGIMRIYWDKIRKYKSHRLMTICQAYEYEKFYDKARTLSFFYKNQLEEEK
jgi:hypothetical protein